MQTRRHFLNVSASAVPSLILSQLFPTQASRDSDQVIKERTSAVQLRELSSLVSDSSGIEQHFELGFFAEPEKQMIIANNDPASYIHILGMSQREGLSYEIREIKEAQFLLNYPSDSEATVIPNPIKDPRRFALVACRSVFSQSSWPYADLTDLASVALEPMTPRGRILEPTNGGRFPYLGLSYLIFDRRSLTRDDGGNLRLEQPFGFPDYQRCLRVIESVARQSQFMEIRYMDPLVHIGPCDVLRQYIVKRVGRRELFSKLARGTIRTHDGSFTYNYRLSRLNRILGRRQYVDLILAEQKLRLSDRRWEVVSKSYFTGETFSSCLFIFERYDNELWLTDVSGHDQCLTN